MLVVTWQDMEYPSNVNQVTCLCVDSPSIIEPEAKLKANI